MLGKGVGGAACTEEHVLVMGHGMCEGHAHIENALHARAGVCHPLPGHTTRHMRRATQGARGRVQAVAVHAACTEELTGHWARHARGGRT